MLMVTRWWMVLTLSVATTLVSAAELKTAAPETVGLAADRLQRIPEMLEQYVNVGRIVGASIQILKNGQVVLSTAVGFRDREAGSAMTTDSIFPVSPPRPRPSSVLG